MTCREALEKLYEVIDKEASEIDIKRVREHLKNCRHCLSRYEFEGLLKTFVADKASPRTKIDELKSRILNSMNELDSARPGLFGGRFRFGAVILSAVATLIICVAAAFTVAEFYRHKVYIYPFEERHIADESESSANLLYFNKLMEVRRQVNDNLDLALDFEGQGYVPIHAGTDEVRGREFVHFRFISGDARISLFIGPADGVHLPDFKRAVETGMEYYKHVCAECQVIYWFAGDAVAIAVSENKQFNLSSLIPAVRSI
jgi:mycothiol system anti-sigma-R factor